MAVRNSNISLALLLAQHGAEMDYDSLRHIIRVSFKWSILTSIRAIA